MKKIILFFLAFLLFASPSLALTGNWEEDIVAVAQSEIGYEESRTNVKKEGFTTHGYTKYGHWYGYDYMEWCVCFVSYCAKHANIPLNLKAGSINQLIQLGKDYNAYLTAAKHAPEKGDIFFRTSEDPYAIREKLINHCGIVEDVNDTIIYTIEGNVDGKVVRKVYFRDDPVLCSYISIWNLMKAGGIKVVEDIQPSTDIVEIILESQTPEEDEYLFD